MKLASIAKARAIALIEVDELNVKGLLRLSDIVPPLVRKFGFQTFPSRPEDYDFDKGVTFLSGKMGDIVIDSLIIFPGLVTLESLSSTADSQMALEAVFSWTRDEIGLIYDPKMIRNWGYISQIVFYTDFPLLDVLSPPLANLALKTGAFVDSLFKEGLKYEVAKVNIGHDPLRRKNSIAGVTIEHRAGPKFDENKFFSEAPLPTDVHIQFLEELETEVLAYKKAV